MANLTIGCQIKSFKTAPNLKRHSLMTGGTPLLVTGVIAISPCSLKLRTMELSCYLVFADLQNNISKSECLALNSSVSPWKGQ